MNKMIVYGLCVCGTLALPNVFGTGEGVDYESKISKMTQKDQKKLFKKAKKRKISASKLLKEKMKKKSAETGISIEDLFRADDVERKKKAGTELNENDKNFLIKIKMKKWRMSRSDVIRLEELDRKNEEDEITPEEKDEYKRLKKIKKKNKKALKDNLKQSGFDSSDSDEQYDGEKGDFEDDDE